MNDHVSEHSFAPPLPGEEDDEERNMHDRVLHHLDRARGWLSDKAPTHWRRHSRHYEDDNPPSDHLITLIPLTDTRLQPRNTRLSASFLFIFALAIAAVVFVSVPRTISSGEVYIQADKMSWNTTTSSYQLKLNITLPIFNPNYLPGASIRGDLRAFFYSTEAGRADLSNISLPPRSLPISLEVPLDASNVPSDYILAILTQCSTFPEQLIFFLKGRLVIRQFWVMEQTLPRIDTYFLIDCRNGGTPAPPAPAPSPLL